MLRADSADLDALAEQLISATRPLALATLRARLGGWTDERLAAATADLGALGASLVESGDGIALQLSDPLDATAIRAALPQHPSFSVTVLRVCSSTNDWVRAKTGRVLCVAEAQTAGRGRRGNAWVQSFGRGLALSFGTPAPSTRLDALAIAMATAATNALLGAGYCGIGLKWPNDLYVHGRKLGGVLVEAAGGAAPRVAIGLGLNVHAAPELHGRSAAALAELGGPPPQRNRLAALLSIALANALDRFDAEGFAPFAREFAALDVLAGQRVNLHEAMRSNSGIARGISESGRLILDTSAGRFEHAAGDVSLDKWPTA
ncbi:MAG: biotin--[acetyl-CoA-carboxylase] ligase [Gammaproteobacteria bacterium]